MKATTLVDWVIDRDLVFHLRRALELRCHESEPLLDRTYMPFVQHLMTQDERARQALRLRRGSSCG